MATWTNPKTINTNDPAPASDWNTHIRDNSLFLYQPPFMAVSKSMPQSVASASFIAVTWDTVLVDSTPTPQFDATNSTWICRHAGWYEFEVVMGWVSAAARRLLEIRHNGLRHRVAAWQSTLAMTMSHSGSKRLLCAVSDTVDVLVFQDSGADLDTISGPTGGRFSALLIHGS